MRLRRFIPARAGNALPAPVGRGHRTVHPRACGERIWHKNHDGPPTGSSPRVRGTPHAMEVVIDVARFIPARAGNAWCPQHMSRCRAVHPRACGERGILLNRAQNVTDSSPRVRGTPFPHSRYCGCGSSPRVRGTHHERACRIVAVRFIPARAGNASRRVRGTQ